METVTVFQMERPLYKVHLVKLASHMITLRIVASNASKNALQVTILMQRRLYASLVHLIA